MESKGLFSRSARLEGVATISDKFSGHSKSFGFVQTTDPSGTDAAIGLDRSELHGGSIKVNEAKPRGGGGTGPPVEIEIAIVAADVETTGNRQHRNIAAGAVGRLRR